MRALRDVSDGRDFSELRYLALTSRQWAVLLEAGAVPPRLAAARLADKEVPLEEASALLDGLGEAGAIVAATIRLTQLSALKPAPTDTDDHTVGYRVLNTPPVDLDRRWSSQERRRAADTGDARIEKTR